MGVHSELQLSMFYGRIFDGSEFLVVYGLSSSGLRKITNCFNKSRVQETLSLCLDARDGMSRCCRVAARPFNGQSAQNCRLFNLDFAEAIFTSKMHRATKIPHLIARRYPRIAGNNLRNRFVRTHSIYSVATSPWHNNKMHCIFRHRSVTFQIIRGPTQCDIVRAVPSHLQYPTIMTDRGTISTAKGASNSRYFPSSNKSSLFSSLFRTGSQQKT